MRILTYILLFLSLSGCEGILNLDLLGNGDIQEQNRTNLLRFNGTVTAVQLSDNFTLEIYPSDVQKLFVEADANLQPFVITELERGRLIVRRKGNFNLISQKPVLIRLYTPELLVIDVLSPGRVRVNSMEQEYMKVHVTSSANVSFSDVLIEHLDLRNEGSGRLNVQGHFERCSIYQVGSGEIVLQGIAQSCSIVQEGSGMVDGSSFIAYAAEISLFGSGLIYCNVHDNLNVKIAGEGRVFYSGSANVTSQISGVGDLIYFEH
jgi:hypothetical protein